MGISFSWTGVLRLSAVLGIVASLITIILFALGILRFPWSSDDEPQVVAPSAQSASPTPILSPEFESLEDFLRYAKSIPVPSERDQGLRTVAEFAVREGDYATAIEAGAYSPSSHEGAKTLSFVALCAAEEGLYETAYQTASKVRISAVESKVKREILNLRNRRSSDVAPSIDDRDVTHCFHQLLD